ncbi:hypothetical protein [Actinorugispora endophytica]|uniref:hypothetical protein n=1 Tax=Actinorugispora endophytica TaxID=1605990 RepID=UPI001FB61912|nr:hypothetical protein [Actinorugispora endophytica]
MSNATYWRRRVFLLIGLLAVLTLIAFACRPSAEENATNSANVDSGPETDDQVAESPDPSIPASPPPSAEPADEPDAGPGGEGGAGGGSGGVGADADADAGAEDGGEGADADRQAVPAPEAPEDACRPEDVVVTLSTDQADYAWDEEPKLSVSVVNTGAQTCTVDIGREAMELRVTSGEDRIWSTADCVEGDAADNEQLRRGVPHTAVVTWERKRSWTDCRDQDSDARSGTYVVTLHSDYDEGAEAQVFRLN